MANNVELASFPCVRIGDVAGVQRLSKTNVHGGDVAVEGGLKDRGIQQRMENSTAGKKVIWTADGYTMAVWEKKVVELNWMLDSSATK